MRLIVLASASDAAPPGLEAAWVLRLVGAPRPDEPPPPGLVRAADDAAAEVRREFPRWLWEWASTSGALEVQTWPGPMSWWWYTPLSEKSPLRSPFIRELFWLTLLRHVLAGKQIEALDWRGDDPALAAAAAELAAQCGVSFQAQLKGAGLRRHWGIALARRALNLVSQLLRWGALKALGFDRAAPRAAEAEAVLYSRFPVLWERGEPVWQERMFGTWPQTVQANGQRVAYAAVCSASLLKLLREWRELRRQCQEQNIVLLEAALSFWDVLRAHLTLRFLWRYAAWRAARRRQPVRYAGLDMRELFWRELDLNALSPEIPFDLALAVAMRGLLARSPKVRAVFLPFENQPMERAVWAGAKAGRGVPVVGVQTGLYTANQMGFAFPVEEMRCHPGDALKSPLPDFLAAYGELPGRIFSERLGEARVCVSGPVRYPGLGREAGADLENFRQAQSLPAGAAFVLVTTSLAPEETLPLLEGAFGLAAEHPEAFLLLKFHYHLPLGREVERLAAQHQCRRYRLFDADLHSLMRLAPVMLTAGSSTGIEALTYGCMPLVFRSLSEMSSNPMLDVPEAVFFWHSLDELRQAFQACLAQDADYQRRRVAWPQAIAAQLFRLDGQADARLYQFLRQRGVL